MDYPASESPRNCPDEICLDELAAELEKLAPPAVVDLSGGASTLSFDPYWDVTAPRSLAIVPIPDNDTGDVIELNYAQRVLPRSRGLVGNPENTRPRSSDARDRRTRDRTAPYFLEELRARGRALSDNPSYLLHDNDDHPSGCNDNPKPVSTATARRKAQDTRDTRLPPDWKRTKDLGKLTAMNRAVAVADVGTPRTWTLNLAPDVVARGLGSRHNGFASWMQKRVHREIVGAVGRPLPFAFGVDVTHSGRPHLHGMIAANDDDMPAIDQALRKAGGTWKAAYPDKQTHYRLAWDTDGWSRYTERNFAAARRIVGPNVIAGTGKLKAAAKELHGRLRAQVAGTRSVATE